MQHIFRNLFVLAILSLLVQNIQAQKQPGSYMREAANEANQRYERQRLQKEADQRAKASQRNSYDPGNSTSRKTVTTPSEPPVMRIIPFKRPETMKSYEGDEDVSGAPMGTGVAIYKDGSSYDGEWLNGIRAGKGKLVFENGTYLEGDWVNDEFVSGSKYLADRTQTGKFINEQLIGNGKEVFKNGVKIFAEYVNNLPVRGIYRMVSGNEYDGGFSQGLPSGVGILTYLNGGYLISHFSYGMAWGYGKSFNAKGILLQEGLWEDKFKHKQKQVDPEIEDLVSKKILELKPISTTSVTKPLVKTEPGKGNWATDIVLKGFKDQKGSANTIPVSAIPPGLNRTAESVKYEYSPIPVFKTANFVSMECGGDFMVGLRNDGSIWGWGKNNYGQLGINNETDQDQLIKLAEKNEWKLLRCGSHHSVAIKNDGTLWDWGLAGGGQTGYIDLPKQKGSSNDWADIASGYSHTMLLKIDGSLWGFGNNYNGELGIGSSESSLYAGPAQVGIDKNWTKVYCGNDFTFAQKTDGSYWAWGQNNYGQLGIGNSTDMNVPVKLDNTADWKAISLGASHSLVLKKDGTLWAFGDNSEGELGIGNKGGKQSIPVQVGKENNWLKIWAGWFYSLAIKKDGTLWAWGENNAGELGIGNTTSQYSPVQVGKDKDWKTVLSGESFPITNTFGIKKDGSVWAWGLKTSWLK